MAEIDRTQNHSCFRPQWLATTGGIASTAILYDLIVNGGMRLLSWAGMCLVVLGPAAVIVTVMILKCESVIKYSLFRIGYTCPKCSYQGVPRFRCLDCKQVVTDLGPTIHGVFLTKCQCGAELPTVDWAGRLSLEKICPNCSADLAHEDLGYNSEYRMAIVGARSSGKTNLMITAVWQLEEQFAPCNDLEVSFGNATEDRLFHNSVEALKKGQCMPQTSALEALNLSLKPEDGGGSLLYIYDAPGEDFQDDQRLGGHPIEKYDGILLVVDPLSEDGIRKGVLNLVDVAELQGANPAPIDATEILSRLVNVLERSLKLPPGGRFQIPIAVAITKVDSCGLGDHLKPSFARPGTCYSSMAHAAYCAEYASPQVRDFLKRAGMGNFIRLVESRFARVGYFGVAALSQTDGSLGYTPRGSLAPFLWLWNYTDALSDRDKFDRTFINADIYVTHCLQGREGGLARVIAWCSLLAVCAPVIAYYMSVSLPTFLFLGGLHFIAMVILCLCLHFALVRGRFED